MLPVMGIEELEAAAAQGWRPLEEERLGDWRLRAAEGFTGRANSALAIRDPGLSLAAATDAVPPWDRRAAPWAPGGPLPRHPRAAPIALSALIGRAPLVPRSPHPAPPPAPH